LQPASPFPDRQRKQPSTPLTLLWSGVAGLFDVRWLLGMRSAIVDRPAPEGATVTYLIPAHNEAGHLTHAVKSLFDQTYPIFSIIVVENGSTDSTWREAANLAKEHPDVIFALNAGNAGSKAGALNAGLDALNAGDFPKGEFIVELDADTKLHPKAIALLLPHFFERTVAVACGQVLPQPYTGKYPSWCWCAKLVEYILGQGLTKEAQNSLGTILVTCGCFSMFHSSLIGKFSHETMAEDMQKTWELQLDGWSAVYEPRSLCYAAEPETLEVYWNQRWRWLCGFLQCYQLFVRELLKRNLRLFLMVHYMFACALLGIVLDLGLLPFGIHHFIKNPTLSVVYASVVNIIVMMVALMYYACRLGGFRLMRITLKSVFPSILGVFVIQCNFLLAILSEMILKRKLTKWKSGHAQDKATTQHILEG
jgi:cellulose synthase/poly-beta-1,6-N-acetylglucosamine synthase-like glycosyltransferase